MDSDVGYALQLNKIKNLQEDLEKQKIENQNLQRRNEELIMLKNQAESEVKACQAEFSKRESEKFGKITFLKEKIEDLNATKERLEQQNIKLKVSNLRLETEKKILEESKNTLTENKKAVETRFNELSETNQSFENEKENYRTKILRLKDSYLKLEREKRDLEKFKEDSQNLVKKLKETESKKAELQTKINDFEKMEEKLRQELKGLRTSYESVQMKNQNKDAARDDEPSTTKEVSNLSSNPNFENISRSVTPYSEEEEEDLEDNEVYEEEHDNNESFMRCTETSKGSVDIGEGIFVHKMLLWDAKQKAKNQESLAILLVKAIFKRQFLRQCSINGPRRRHTEVKYAFPKKVLNTVLDYSFNYAKKKNWTTVDNEDILRGIDCALLALRREKLPFHLFINVSITDSSQYIQFRH